MLGSLWELLADALVDCDAEFDVDCESLDRESE